MGGAVANLSATELALLRGFVRDVLATIEYDDTGVTADLEDQALQAAEILRIVVAPPEEDLEEEAHKGPGRRGTYDE